jgi:ABC-type nitrate/sulfonate/bicarbonate transport system substrate-binding protein
MDKIAFPYRSGSHLVLLHVIAESGSWEKHGLQVDYDRKIGSVDSQKAVASGDIEFIGGNHVSTYGLRARGIDWVYLGQTVNQVNHQLVARADSGIHGIADLRGKKIGTRGSHPTLNNWLYLKQKGLDLDRDDYEFVSQSVFIEGTMDEVETGPKPPALWKWVLDGTVDAAFMGPPSSLFAQAAGLKVIDVEPLPMIQFTSLSTSLKFVQKYPDIVDRFLKGVIEGIHFFKTRPDETAKIIQKRITRGGGMTLEQAAQTQQNLARILEPKLYPKMQAIANVYEEALRQDKEARNVNPMELWDLHHIRRLDDSGFVDNLYGTRKAPAQNHGHDHAHADAKKDAAGKVSAAPAIDHTACDEECAATH